MWNNSSHLAMISFFMANTFFEIGYFYKVTSIAPILILEYGFLSVRVRPSVRHEKTPTANKLSTANTLSTTNTLSTANTLSKG